MLNPDRAIPRSENNARDMWLPFEENNPDFEMIAVPPLFGALQVTGSTADGLQAELEELKHSVLPSERINAIMDYICLTEQNDPLMAYDAEHPYPEIRRTGTMRLCTT